MEELDCIPTRAAQWRPPGQFSEFWELDQWPTVSGQVAGDTVTFSWSPPRYPAKVCTQEGDTNCAVAGGYTDSSIVPSILWPETFSGTAETQVPGDFLSDRWLERYQDLSEAGTPDDWGPKGSRMTLTRIGSCGVERATTESFPGEPPLFLPRQVHKAGLTDTSCSYLVSGKVLPAQPTHMLVGFQTVPTVPGGEKTASSVFYLAPTDAQNNDGILTWGSIPGCWPTVCQTFASDNPNQPVIEGLLTVGAGTVYFTMDGPGLSQLKADFTYKQVNRNTLRFDASTSSGAGFTSYRWRFGPNPGDEVTEGDPLIDRSFTESGTRKVTLTVTAPDGRTASVTKDVDLPGLRVNSVGDNPATASAITDGTCDTGGTVGDVPECTLRAAIQVANAGTGPDTIEFRIPGSGTPRISPATPLPPITDATIVDGTSQQGGVVALSGASAGTNAVGLALAGEASTIQGMVINGFGGAGIRTSGGASGHRVVSTVVGLAPDLATAAPNGVGIDVGTPGAVIGSVDQPNVVSGNTIAGIRVAARGADVVGNRVGTTPDGTAAVGNGTGVLAVDAVDLTVGPSNLIAGNRLAGILVESSTREVTGARIHHNVIGLSSEESLLPNGLGVVVSDGPARPNTGTIVEENTITGNNVEVLVAGEGVGDTVVRFNKIGTNSQGNDLGIAPQPSTRMAGVRVDGAVGTVIQNNVVVSHSYGEVVVHGRDETTVVTNGDGSSTLRLNWYPSKTLGAPATGHGTVVKANELGTVANGGRTDTVVGAMVAYRAKDVSIGPGNTIGHAKTSAVFAAHSEDVRVVGNRIGLTSADAPAPNQAGVQLISTKGAVVGGPGDDANVITSNSATGVLVRGGMDMEGVVISGGVPAEDTVVAGNTITANGSGVIVDKGAVSTLVGGTAAGAGNVITGNGGIGAYVGEFAGDNPNVAQNTRFVRNRIGITPGGSLAPNGDFGLQIGPSRGSVADRNLVHGKLYGLLVSDGVNAHLTRNQVWGASTSNLFLQGNANGSLPAPTLTSVESDGKSSTVWVDVPAGGPYTLELFSNGSCEPGPPEARGFLASATVESGPTSIKLPDTLDPGTGLTATVVSEDLRTSALSGCMATKLPGNKAVVFGPNGERIVLTGPEGSRFLSARSVANPDPDTTPQGAQFPIGFLDFKLTDLKSPFAVVEIEIPDGVHVDSYYRHGPTSNGNTDWYEWKYDANLELGAEILDGKIRLHFVDGFPGDDDGAANGTIVDPGAPVVLEPDEVDTTPPLITPKLVGKIGQGGWYVGDVTVSWNVVDDESSVTSTSGCETSVLTSDSARKVLKCTATSGGGTVERTTSVKRDATAPVVTWAHGTPAGGARVTFGVLPREPAPCSATDATAGVTHKGCVITGYSTSVGVHTVTASAIDRAGNTTVRKRTYTVLPWPFKGFSAPVANAPAVNTVHAGARVQVRFSLGANRGLGILADGSPTSAPADCRTWKQTAAARPTVASQPGLTFTAKNSEYAYPWSTAKTWKGQCRILTVTLDDGTMHKAYFKFTGGNPSRS